jgi:glycogen debranching enzyme
MQEAVGYDSIAGPGEFPSERTLVLKHDRLFLVVNPQGDVAPPGRGTLGLFHDDTRILSHYALRVEGGPPSLLSTQALQLYAGQIDLAVKDLPFGGYDWEPRNAIHLRRELLLDERHVERVSITSYLRTPIDYWMALDLACDFADIFEVRGWRRERRGVYFEPDITPRSLTFSYRGLDDVTVHSTVQFAEPPDEIGPRGALWRFRLEPGRRHHVLWEVFVEQPASGARAPGIASRRRGHGEPEALEARRLSLDAHFREWRRECSSWRSDVAAFDDVLGRAADDLRALYTTLEGNDNPAGVISGGIPWYSTVFGRDSIITSLQTLPLNPRIALDTLRYLAAHQGRQENRFTEEQPGKIMHELRRGEMARSGEIPHIPYFGSVDATPLWLILLHETWRWTGNDELVHELLPTAEQALAWLDRFGDVDGDGFQEYARTSERGLVNQGWKDSVDGVPFPDGRMPRPPIALVEVQGYVCDAKLRMASIYDRLGARERAAELRHQAARLREQILERFWLEELGTFALALDGEKQPLPTVTTNAGHLLWSRVPDDRQARRMEALFLGTDMFSGWGIRTLSAAHPVFNPMSYHNGSIWPHDNALVILGLAFYGLGRGALPVLRGLYEAALHTDFRRLPELFCGMRREQGMHPVRYPVSCSPQAWASGAFFMVLQAMLGLFPAAPDRLLHIRNPTLPDFLDDLTVTGLAIGHSKVSLRFRRHGERTLTNLLGVEGEPLRVQIDLD